MNVAVTGPRGSGKTTVLSSVVSRLKGKVVELRSRALTVDGKVTGFALRTPDGVLHPFAHERWQQHQRFMRYGCEPAVFGNLVPALRRWTAGADAFLFDELGVMEDSAAEFATFLNGLLDSELPVFLAVKQEFQGDLIRNILGRHDVTVWDLQTVPPERARDEILALCSSEGLL